VQRSYKRSFVNPVVCVQRCCAARTTKSAH